MPQGSIEARDLAIPYALAVLCCIAGCAVGVPTDGAAFRGDDPRVEAPQFRQDPRIPILITDRYCVADDPTRYVKSLDCTPPTVCSDDEYEIVAPTPWSDRVCAPITGCSSREYESVAPTLTSDRECSPLTRSEPNQYESAAPTPTSDRVCAPITVCGAAQYEAAAPSTTSDRHCLLITQCSSSEYELTPPTDTSDRVCNSLTPCNSDEYQIRAPTPTSDRNCAPLTVCEATQYEAQPASATSNRVCRELTVCQNTEYQAVAPTPQSDRICATIINCGQDEYEFAPPSPISDRICRAFTQCSADEYEAAPPGPTHDRTCLPLTHCTDEEYESIAPTPFSDRTCSPLTVCDSDQREATGPTPESDRVCEDCPFGAEGDGQMCTRHSTYVFATSVAYPGYAIASFPGGADGICQFHADEAGLAGRWVAFLSHGPDELAIDRIRSPDFDGPYRNMHDEEIASQYQHPLTGLVNDNGMVRPLRAAVRYDEYGEFQQDQYGAAVNWRVWTGMRKDGTLGEICGPEDEPWSSSAALGTIGRTDVYQTQWVDKGSYSCSYEARLLCFQG